VSGIISFDGAILIVTVVPSLLVIYRLQTKGTSKKLKSTILYRNTFILIIYLIFSGSILFEAITPTGYSGGLWNIFKQNWPLRLVGIPLALVYLFEPYVFSVFQSEMNAIGLGCIVSIIPCKRKQYDKQSLNSFLNSASNIEFVSLIFRHQQSDRSKGIQN